MKEMKIIREVPILLGYSPMHLLHPQQEHWRPDLPMVYYEQAGA